MSHKPNSPGFQLQEEGRVDSGMVEVLNINTDNTPPARRLEVVAVEESTPYTAATPTTPGSTATSYAPTSGGGSGYMVATSSGSKKPRGRPKGSKNKPKPPVVITQRDESAMHATVLEICPGVDVVGAVSDFALQRRVGVSVMGACGMVSTVVLRHSGLHGAVPPGGSTPFALQGSFDIVNFSGTCLPPHADQGVVAEQLRPGFSISVAGPQGMLFGGVVAGEVTAAGTVVVLLATFGTAEYRRVPPSPEWNPAEMHGPARSEMECSQCTTSVAPDVKPVFAGDSSQVEVFGGGGGSATSNPPGIPFQEVPLQWSVSGSSHVPGVTVRSPPNTALRRQHF